MRFPEIEKRIREKLHNLPGFPRDGEGAMNEIFTNWSLAGYGESGDLAFHRQYDRTTMRSKRWRLSSCAR